MKKHPGYFALFFVIAGILCADLTHAPSWVFLTALLVTASTGWTAVLVRRPQLAAAAFGFVLAGLSALGYAVRVYDFGPDHFTRRVTYGERYRIVGRVDDWPNLRPDRTDLTVAVDTIVGDRGTPVSGRLLVRVDDTTTAVERGDLIEFYGRINPVPRFRPGGGFNYGRFLRLHSVGGLTYLRSIRDIRVSPGTRYRLTGLVDRLRHAITGALHRHLSPVSAALAAGFLIGETRDIPPGVYRQFRDSGTLHLLAVSGSNVALVVLFALVMLRPFGIGRRPRAIVLLLVVGLFTMLSYEQPSVVRAAVMASLVIIAGLVERRIDLNHIVATAAVIILLAAPTQLFDIGFQLSFVTAWGLIFATPRVYALGARYHNCRWFRWLALPLSVAVIAQLFSTPLSVLYFQRIPLISPLANLVIVPLVSIAVVGVLAILAATLVFPPLAHLLGTALDSLMRIIEYLLRFFTHGHLPLLETGPVPPLLAIVAYACLVLGFLASASHRARRALSLTTAVVAVVILIRLAWPTVFPTSAIDIRIATVPGGLATVISSMSSGSTDLALTGLTAKSYPVDERVILPLLHRAGVNRLRSLILLSADFNALAYVARLADTLGIERLYLHQRLKAAWADFVSFSGHRPVSPVTIFGGAVPVSASDGLALDSTGVRLQLAGGEVLVADPRSTLAAPATGSPIMLVTDRRGFDLGVYLSLLGPDRYDWIVCAKVAQDRRTDAPLPPRLIDLDRFGQVRVRIDRDAQNSLQVFGLD